MSIGLRILLLLVSLGAIVSDLWGIDISFTHLIHAGNNVGGIIGWAFALIVLVLILIPVGFFGVFGMLVGLAD